MAENEQDSDPLLSAAQSTNEAAAGGEGAPEADDKSKAGVNDGADAKEAEGAGNGEEGGEGEAPEGDEAELQLKLPDDVEILPEAVQLVSGKFKELGLTQEQAQKVVDLYASELLPMLSQQQADMSAEARQAQSQAWVEQVAKDKEIGGENFHQTAHIAQKALARFGTPQLKQLLEETGLGNNIEFVRFFRKVGMSISEDTLHLGGQTATKPKSPEEQFYPNLTQQ